MSFPLHPKFLFGKKLEKLGGREKKKH